MFYIYLYIEMVFIMTMMKEKKVHKNLAILAMHQFQHTVSTYR